MKDTMKTKKGFLNLEGGSHSIVPLGNKLDVTTPEMKTYASYAAS